MLNGSPPQLGRGVVIASGGQVPEPWRGSPVVAIDEAVMADPGQAVTSLHLAWLDRRAVVVELAVDHRRLREPISHAGDPWLYPATFTPWFDRLHFLCWANNYDARTSTPRWWWTDKAIRLGARPVPAGEPGDVLLPDGSRAWIDGGPREPLPLQRLGASVIHRDSVDLGSLDIVPAQTDLTPGVADVLAPDQLAAVAHHPGGARILAPAGSGKTRVLTERLRLLASWGWERDATLAVAYNVRARDELVARTSDFQPRVQTLNSLGLAVVRAARGTVTLADDRDIRHLVQRLAPPRPRRANTDPILPYVEALSIARLGLRDPSEVEAERDDIPGFADLVPRYRAALTERGSVDFDEQILGAVQELLADGAFRRAAQARWGRHLLVDEFQDLTPAHLLMLRLLAAPALDLFAVGDDDQVIYGHAGADPSFLVEYTRDIPGAATHPLEVNYRCPLAVVRSARTLLSYNKNRVAKTIEPAPDADDRRGALEIRTCPPERRLTALVDHVRCLLDDGAAPEQIAVLARVNAQLLGPHVALSVAGFPVASTVGSGLLDRTGARAALAYLRLATAPRGAMRTEDLVEVLRRPSRGLPQWFPERLERRSTWTLSQLADLAANLGGKQADRNADKVDRLVADLRLVAGSASAGTTASTLATVRDKVGLGRATDLLDGNRGGGSGSHGDDLDALEQVAHLQADPAAFEGWLRAVLDASHAGDTFGRPESRGVTIATIHRVKGLEWDHVAVHGADDGLLPHRLSDDFEEERRVLHVAITRCRRSVVVLADEQRPSPFLDELLGVAPAPSTRRAKDGLPPRRRAGSDRQRSRQPQPGLEASVGMHVSVLGGYEGTIAAVDADGAQLALGSGGRLRVRWGEEVTVTGRPMRLVRPGGDATDDGRSAERFTRLRDWRRERAKTDGVPAFVVLNDRYLDGIATANPRTLEELMRCDGIGPVKLELYGDDILDVLASV